MPGFWGMTEGQQAKQSSQPGGQGMGMNMTGSLGVAGVQTVPGIVIGVWGANQERVIAVPNAWGDVDQIIRGSAFTSEK